MFLNHVSVAATAGLASARLGSDAELSFFAVDFERHVFLTRAFETFGLAPVALTSLAAPLCLSLAAAAG
jgi:hypothetical protein